MVTGSIARSGARRSGDETSAGAAAALRGHPFLSICCYDDIIVVVLLSLPHNKRRKFFTLEVAREGFLFFYLSFLFSAGIPFVVVVLASLCSRAVLMTSTSIYNNAPKTLYTSIREFRLQAYL